MNCDDPLVAMWSSIVLFVLTFAVLGLLLGFAAVYDTNQQAQMGNASTQENVITNVTQSSQRGNAVGDEGREQ